MKKRPYRTEVTRQGLLEFFSEIDTDLQRKGAEIGVTILGGAAIILQGFRERATRDIDIAQTPGALAFQKVAEERGIPVDIITISSTVDFNQAPKIDLYQGKALKVQSVKADDLVKLKLERFRKQDPEDIYAILEKTGMDFEHFLLLVQDMIPDYIGNPRELALSARLVVERIYPDRINDFKV